MVLGRDYNDSSSRDNRNLFLTLPASKSQTDKFEQNLSCSRATSMFGLASTNSTIIFKSPYTTFSLSFFKHFNQEQNFWKFKSYKSWSYWSLSQVKRPLCNSILNANRNCTSLLENHEEWASFIQDCCHFHYPKNTLWWERIKLYLRHSRKILCCINCLE